MKKEIKIGDWVNSYSKGIFRVERIIENYYEEADDPSIIGKHKIGDKQKDRTFITKRLLNLKLKKSIGYDNCSEHYISHLSKTQTKELENILADSPKLLTELNNYQIPTLTTIYNSDLQIDDKKDLEIVLTFVEFIKGGKTFLEIEEEMKRLDILRLKPKFFGNYKLQLINIDEEIVDKRKIWRDAKLTKKD